MMISIMIFLRLKNFDYLNNINLELDSMHMDPTFLIVSIHEILSNSFGALFILLCILILIMINTSNRHLKKVRFLEVFSCIIMLLLVLFILISSVSYGRDVHLLPFIVHSFCMLSFVVSPSINVIIMQVILYFILSILLLYSLLKVLRKRGIAVIEKNDNL